MKPMLSMFISNSEHYDRSLRNFWQFCLIRNFILKETSSQIYWRTDFTLSKEKTALKVGTWSKRQIEKRQVQKGN
jgi:hypothetical protein